MIYQKTKYATFIGVQFFTLLLFMMACNPINITTTSKEIKEDGTDITDPLDSDANTNPVSVNVYTENLQWPSRTCVTPTNNVIHVGPWYEIKTLQQAQETVRMQTSNGTNVPVGGLTVLIHKGEYVFDSSLVFTSADSGTPDRKITWQAACGEDVRFTGSQKLETSWFKKISSTTPGYFRVPSEARSHVYFADLKLNNIPDLFPLVRRGYSSKEKSGPSELIFNGEMMTLARWPNKNDVSVKDGSMYVTGNFGTGADINGRYIPLDNGTVVASTLVTKDVNDGYMNYKLDHPVVYNGVEYQYYLYHCTNKSTGSGEWLITPYNPQSSTYIDQNGVSYSTASLCAPWDWRDSSGVLHPDVFPTPAKYHAYHDGKIMTWADWVNVKGMFTPYAGDTIIEEGFARYLAIDTTVGKKFKFPGSRYTNWQNKSNVWFHARYAQAWADDTQETSIDANGMVTVPLTPPMSLFKNYGYVYAMNIMEELDRPGEYYLDHANKLLYFYPTADMALADIALSQMNDPLIKIESNAVHLNFQGLIFEKSRNTFIAVKDSSFIYFSDILIRNGGALGMTITNSKNVTINHSKMYNLGSGGIKITDSETDRLALLRSENTVQNSEFYGLERWDRTYSPAINIHGCGIIISNNYFHDLPHAAIMFTGNDHLIANNLINNVITEANDSGAIYTSGRNYSWRGTTIKNNVISKVGDTALNQNQDNPAAGIYFDGLASGHVALYNTLYDIHGYAFSGGGSRDLSIHNNIISNVRQACFTTSRAGLSLITATTLASTSTSWWEHFSYNMLYWLNQVNYQGATWAEHYPQLAIIPNNAATLLATKVAPAGSPLLTLNPAYSWRDPENTYFSDNVCHNAPQIVHEGNTGGSGALKIIKAERNVTTDPVFTDAENNDFTLSSDSALKAVEWINSVTSVDTGININ